MACTKAALLSLSLSISTYAMPPSDTWRFFSRIPHGPSVNMLVRSLVQEMTAFDRQLHSIVEFDKIELNKFPSLAFMMKVCRQQRQPTMPPGSTIIKREAAHIQECAHIEQEARETAQRIEARRQQEAVTYKIKARKLCHTISELQAALERERFATHELRATREQENREKQKIMEENQLLRERLSALCEQLERTSAAMGQAAQESLTLSPDATRAKEMTKTIILLERTIPMLEEYV